MIRTKKVTSTTRRIGGYSPGSQIRRVPTLTISGIWLAKAGFAIGDQTTVTVEKGRLLIVRK
ncbi:type I addiction module toxin, SymE family [Spirosoma sp. HMF3257]|uniref:Type I toxin-antitoxin system SymE family toxin n=1 Tax=Spirosoma telluris TaxID=2183553 RepID=A0A327NCR5_9BACT|nr:type I addiction module toxin, SymE family [Spirosoma telluris]RAI72862.1 type I toxin-antitoxin system SymE family toxin [Spirosoma telluris]